MAGELEKTDNVATLKDAFGNLGTLKIEVWRINKGALKLAGPYTPENAGSVPEKALKGQPIDVKTRLVLTREHRIKAHSILGLHLWPHPTRCKPLAGQMLVANH